jgi:hypothetical protein
MLTDRQTSLHIWKTTYNLRQNARFGNYHCIRIVGIWDASVGTVRDCNLATLLEEEVV